MTWTGAWQVCTALILLGGVTSCAKESPKPVARMGYGEPVGPFKDDVQSNTTLPTGMLELQFVDHLGQHLDLSRYRGRKHLVLVIMRGFPGFVCPNCSAQTSRLIANYPEFVKRNTEILVVYPGPRHTVQDYLDLAKEEPRSQDLPFPILLDEDFKVVERLGIRGDLAKPSTYIVDRNGLVRFAYVGATSSDRPSITAMLRQLDAFVGSMV